MSNTSRRLFDELMKDDDFRQLVTDDEKETDDDEEPRRVREGVRPTGDAFYRALQENPPPCDGCPFAQHCAQRKLACVEFATWADRAFLTNQPVRAAKVATLTPDAPYAWVYDELFPPTTPEAWAEEYRQLEQAIDGGRMKKGRPF